MKRIVLIHTVKVVYDTFEDKLYNALRGLDDEIKIHNILDDFLAYDVLPSENGCFTGANKRRLLFDLMSAELTGADLIVTTCSQLSPVVGQMRFSIGTPVITIDDAMIKKAVSISDKIGLLSSASGTVPPMQETVETEARRQGKYVELQIICNNNAIMALRDGNMELHDRLIREMALSVDDCDSLIIAQASAAHMRPEVERIAGIPAFSGMDMCIGQIKDFFAANDIL